MPGTPAFTRLGFLLAFSTTSACSSAPPKPAKEAAPPSVEQAPSERAQLDPMKVSYAMRGNEENYRKCFMTSMSSRGAISARFDIDTRGIVQQVGIENSAINSESVQNCLKERLTAQKFGNQQQDATGHWTFVFRLTDPIDESTRDELLEEAEDDEDAIALLPESQGSIDLHRLDDVIHARYPLYAHCYRDSISRRGESRGLVRFRMTIDDQGKVLDIEDDGSVMPDPFAVDCMAEAFYAMPFPAASGPKAVVRYSLLLN